ncbi:MAG: 2-C-methyl-D-erythritol 4-phosphate cytidylyltransferase [Lachnospiraceae bacterium]|jgi:2-C-methyl-D-erythritol 4-phosphate cytidylyltransferase|nr:2-C-methyl-D-erythritol 4-phosphate cytidylyltransferase [Lachnospiraceae bacterium]
MEKRRYAAVVLSAGRGSRMNASVPKQYLMLKGRPIIYYALQTFQQSRVEEIVLVSGEEDLEYCQKEIVEKYGVTKVKAIVPGGKERYHSVFHGLAELDRLGKSPDYVMIHDGARPFVDQQMIDRCVRVVEAEQACVVGMPVKDTIKITDEAQYAIDTPPRNRVWQVQTPQVFSFPLIYQAYQELLRQESEGKKIAVTDDAMVVETIYDKKVRLVEGSYKNIKITTPEDLEIAETFLGCV